MNIFRNLNKSFLSFLILFFSLATFLAGLFAVIAFQSKYLSAQKIETAVIEAERLVSFDPAITLERALKLYSGTLSFAVFDKDCNPIYVTDLLIMSQTCQARHENFTWKEIDSPTEKKLLIGFATHFSLKEYLNEYKLILFPTIGTYVIFILILTFIFLRIFVEEPIKKISQAIDTLLQTKHFNANTFQGSQNNLLSPLFAALSRLIEEVVRFNREEEKLLMSQQIAHDLRAPLSILERQFQSITNLDSVEKIALKRLRDISDGLMPENQLVKKSNINVKILFDELTQLYPAISFKINLPSALTQEVHLSISEIELFRFLSNIIKNSIEAGSQNIVIHAHNIPSFFEISLADDGQGTGQENVPKIMKGYTSKSDGHGMGVSALFSKLNSLGGELIIKTSPNNGFKTTIRIPLQSSDKITYVLIDDDKLIRIGWKCQAEKAGIDLKCFESIDRFLDDQTNIPKDARIYVDSSLKNGVKGEIDSEKIAKLGFFHIFLATGYSKSYFNLQEYPWIQGVSNKSPPF
jgi:signal transduction histidine kinase